MRPNRSYDFIPERHEQALTGIVAALETVDVIDTRSLTSILKRFPKDGCAIYSKSEIIRGVRHFAATYGWDAAAIAQKLRMKPVRTQSGVAPVTVLTKPFPCPGKCVFCPNDVRMPKSYLSMEPGAQRATQNRFDPFAQTAARLRAFHINGHQIDKVELIILGGTWSFYPEAYQIWFIKRCFDAMNAFAGDRAHAPDLRHSDFMDLDVTVKGESLRDGEYNDIVSRHLKLAGSPSVPDFERATWDQLEEVQVANETAISRCVGLVVETRPDYVDEVEVLRIRRLGATKVQLGIQSLSDRVLEMNQRGHTAAQSRRAMRLLRLAGFKLHVHWMLNLFGADSEREYEEFKKLFADPDVRPDELKLYPCSLIETAELMKHYRSGDWAPYSHETLIEILAHCMTFVPRYCRTSRVIRDIPSHDIVDGNKLSNLREFAEREILEAGNGCLDIRSREIRTDPVDAESLELCETSYGSGVAQETFFEFVTPDDRIVAFLRYSAPSAEGFIDTLRGAAMIREVHVYGAVVGIGDAASGRSQHLGLGRRLVDLAIERARADGFAKIAVISAIGTREYYRGLGFEDDGLYLVMSIRR